MQYPINLHYKQSDMIKEFIKKNEYDLFLLKGKIKYNILNAKINELFRYKKFARRQ